MKLNTAHITLRLEVEWVKGDNNGNKCMVSQNKEGKRVS